LASWRLYVATVAYDGAGTTITLYRGAGGAAAAELVDQESLPGVRFHNPSGTHASQIGGSSLGSGGDCNRQFFYQGRIDDVRIYTRALSPPEVNALLNEVP
jgi:hypothetical protein